MGEYGERFSKGRSLDSPRNPSLLWGRRASRQQQRLQRHYFPSKYRARGDQASLIDPSLVKRIGAATAIETRATAIHYDFAPGLAVCRDPRWGQCYESYSEDTKIVRAMTEIVPGLQGDIPPGSKKGVPFLAGKTKVAACAKYYVGDGGTINGTDKGNTVIDSHELLSIHMPPYVDSIQKGVASVMVGYSSWNGKKMHVNHDLVTGFLKEKLKFKGFVISGWAGVAKITNPPHINYSSSVQASILAGIDIVMLPDIFTDFVDDLTFQVKNGIIPMSRIDDAVRRVLRVKFTMGLFENPFTDLSLVNELGSQEHRKLATEAVRRSLVLLKNGKRANQPLLPLEKKVKKVLVAGTHADNLGYQCGGFTVDWQGVTGNDLILGIAFIPSMRFKQIFDRLDGFRLFLMRVASILTKCLKKYV
ncbi:Glycosyl hydrolase family protein [Perilla frutescens var. frutescens]|nr:Glycosyl hydrolase family protein [Perilla frutescens var. frutescens]